MTTTASTDPTDVAGDAPIGVCGAGVWLLAATGPDPLDEYRAYRTHCQAPPNHPGDHTVRVVGEPDDATTPAQPVTLTWPNTRTGGLGALCGRCWGVTGMDDCGPEQARASLRVLHEKWDEMSALPGTDDYDRLLAAIVDATHRLIAVDQDQQDRVAPGRSGCTCASAPSQGPA